MSASENNGHVGQDAPKRDMSFYTGTAPDTRLQPEIPWRDTPEGRAYNKRPKDAIGPL